MRTAVILLTCAFGVAVGVYFLWAYALTDRRSEEETKQEQKIAAELSELRNQFNAFKEMTRREKNDYESRIAELHDKIAVLEEKVSTFEKAQKPSNVGTKPPETPAVQPPKLAEGQAPDAESGEKRGFPDMIQRMGEWRIAKLKEAAQKFGWDTQKTEQVIAIIVEENKQTQELFKSYEGTPPEQIDRQAIMHQIKQIHINAVESLKQYLSEDEFRQLEDIITPRPAKRLDKPERPDKSDRPDRPGKKTSGQDLR